MDGSDGQWPWQRPPPYQPIEEIQPLFGQDDEPMAHNSGAVKEKKQRSRKILVFIVIFLIGALIGYTADRSHIYGLYERWGQEEAHRASTRAQWIEEVKQHEIRRTRMEEEIRKWNAERKKWEDEQDRRHASLTWEEIHPTGRCLRYATREYKAHLSNIGIGTDGLAECANKTLTLHGREVLPTFCNLEGPCHRVTGHWAIDFDENTSCSPWWGTLSDKGCDAAVHKRHYEAHLMNVQKKDDWKVLCETTPATIKGIRYDGAMSCVDSVWGVFGTWFVNDMNCSF